jgi:hypothetical protein
MSGTRKEIISLIISPRSPRSLPPLPVIADYIQTTVTAPASGDHSV